MSIADMPWWEREKLLTDADKRAIQKAIYARWEDIDEDTAETDAGRYEMHRIAMQKYHAEEFNAGIL